MKGLILSGGKGTRLRPITHTAAKQLVPVANKPILFYGIEALRDAGVVDIGIVVGYTKNEIIEAVGDGSGWGVNITYIEQQEPLGLAHAVMISKEFIKDSDFVMYLGDNIIRDGINPLIFEFQQLRPTSMILLAEVSNPSQFGVAELQGNKVIKLTEKPEHPNSNLALVGVYMFRKEIFQAVTEIIPSARGELEITDAIQWLIDKGYEVHPHVVRGWWKDTGKLEDMLEANRLILDGIEPTVNEGIVDDTSKIIGRVILQPGAQVVNSVIRGPAIIGKHSKIVNSYVGPFSAVYFGVTIENSEIAHSIVLENSIIKNMVYRIEDSLIGKNVCICKSQGKPKALRFMVGDQSMVQLL